MNLQNFLLGIKTDRQLAEHPLRGVIFENMAVSEIWRDNLNTHNSDSNLFFYRENSGREVDVLVEQPDGIQMYEVKASATSGPNS